MLSDIEIAQQAEMQKIREVAAGLSIESTTDTIRQSCQNLCFRSWKISQMVS